MELKVDIIHTAWHKLTTDDQRFAKLRHHVSLGYPVPTAWVEWLLTKVAK